jgi:hypothetical protein
MCAKNQNDGYVNSGKCPISATGMPGEPGILSPFEHRDFNIAILIFW